MDIHQTSLVLFNTFLIPVSFFSFLYYIISLRSVFSKEEEKEEEEKWELPKVTIQIPTYNEPVAIRCAKSCLKFDYPPDKFNIIIGDDSSNPKVSRAIDEFADKHDNVTVTKRGHNQGFKAGNLNYMLKFSDGEIIIIFDSDFIAEKDFLKRMVKPFQNEKVGAVQAEWDFLNEETNYISKLSSTLLMFYYSLIAPLNKKLGVSFLFGSGEAVRKDLIEKMGGWQEGSLTEDTDFTLRMFKEGYKVIYLNNVKVKGEVPYTLKGLMSQQRRWAYGNTRAFLDHASAMIYGPFSLLQKIMIAYTTHLGYLSNLLLFIFLITGLVYFFSQPPAPINLTKFFSQTSRVFLATSGFITGGAVALFNKDKLKILFPSLISIPTIGVLVSFSVCVGFFKALLGREMVWSEINKEGNFKFISPEKLSYGKDD